MKTLLPLLKKIFFTIFILHVGWFLYFVFTHFSDAFDLNKLKLKWLIAVVALLLAAYFFWLQKFTLIKKWVGLLSKIIFVGYVFFFIYFLVGFIFNPPITITQVASLLQGHGLKRDYISYANMGSNIKLAVIASEDQTFADHDGFDLKAIKRAIKYNKKHVTKIRGASTISQQTAKNIFLFQGGGFLRKIPEVFFTFTIETGYSKKIILERYLNCIEMGRGIFGVQAAAKNYFNKDAKNLSKVEAAKIAACLPNPKIYTVKPLSRYVALRYPNILTQMNNIETDTDVQEIIK